MDYSLVLEGQNGILTRADLKDGDVTIISYTPKKYERDEFLYFGKGKRDLWQRGNGSPFYPHIGHDFFTPPDEKRTLVHLFEFTCQESERFEGKKDAISSSREQKANQLLKFLAESLSPNLAAPYNETLMHIAAKYGRTEAMDLLVKSGANARARTTFKRRTPEDYLTAYKAKKTALKQPNKMFMTKSFSR